MRPSWSLIRIQETFLLPDLEIEIIFSVSNFVYSRQLSLSATHNKIKIDIIFTILWNTKSNYYVNSPSLCNIKARKYE